jgi:AGCS family alanine or glycine:cation symporter
MGYKKLSVLFCVLCVLCSFGTGNLTQVGAISSFLASLGVETFISAVVCVLIIGLAVFGGRTRIAKVNTFLVPFSSAVYIIACVVILAMNWKNVPSALSRIIGSAFGFSSVVGGFSGALVSKTLREGFVRSIFSNEAGMGSSSLAHASAETNDIGIQAEWGIFEIFFDTFVVSTLTAFCLLSAETENVNLLFASSFGSAGTLIIGVLSAVFAFASVISWCFYAECCLSFLFEKSTFPKMIYRVLFSLSAVFGVWLSVTAIWDIADILNALMMFPNMFLMFRCRNEIERIN